VNFCVRALAWGNDSAAAAWPVGWRDVLSLSGTGGTYRLWVVSPIVTTTPDPRPDEPGTARSPAASPEDAVLREARSVLEETEPRAEAQMRSLDSDRRLLLVHAHPDDETISTGATMAKYVTEGVQVTLVTCTLGEEGEVLVPELAHLAADKDDRLGQHRVGELATAMEALGVRDHRYLGGAGRYRDSGMMGLPTNDRPDAFWQADLDEAAGHLVELVRALRPQVLVTYDENGGYGHPDHIQAHRVAMRAAELAADPGFAPDDGEPWEISKIYWSCVPESWLRDSMRRMRDAGEQTFFDDADPDGDLPLATPDEDVTTAVDAVAHVDAKLAAMRAHSTQITVDGPFFALSNNLGNEVWGTEFYQLVKGTVGTERDEQGWETDLFAGLD
jgi:N-acetyl-1-D-myo-inositol-2-amino-2-deoxy-alpha-D-glucopyranoside deacetylase